LAYLKRGLSNLINIAHADIRLGETVSGEILTKGGMGQRSIQSLFPVRIVFTRIHANRFIRTAMILEIRFARRL